MEHQSVGWMLELQELLDSAPTDDQLQTEVMTASPLPRAATPIVVGAAQEQPAEADLAVSTPFYLSTVAIVVLFLIGLAGASLGVYFAR